MTSILGIIPARGGSKRLPGKNIRPLLGRPLIDYVISAAKRTSELHRCIVSTDDPKIRDVALDCGADVPFIRPAELAEDASPTEDTLRHAVLYIEETTKSPVDIVVLLQATSPFTTPSIIQACLKRYRDGDCGTVITVRETPARCEWAGLLREDNRFVQIIGQERYFELLGQREYVPSGNVYIFGREILFGRKKIIGEDTAAVVVSSEVAVDIDHAMDFAFAEFLLEKKLIRLD